VLIPLRGSSTTPIKRREIVLFSQRVALRYANISGTAKAQYWLEMADSPRLIRKALTWRSGGVRRKVRHGRLTESSLLVLSSFILKFLVISKWRVHRIMLLSI
jgi:hypothetical protein